MSDPFDIDITDIDMPELDLEAAKEATNFTGSRGLREELARRAARSEEEIDEEALKLFTLEELEEVSQVSEKQVIGECCIEIHSPKELWTVGAVKVTYNLSEEFTSLDAMGSAQDLWNEFRDEFADEIAAATARENMMTLPQRNLIEELVEGGTIDEIPEGFDEFSKAQASKAIQEAIAEGQANRNQSTSRRQNRSSSRSSTRSRSRRNARGGNSRRGRSSGRSSNRGGSGGGGTTTEKQESLIRRLCQDLDEDPEAGFMEMSTTDASKYIKNLIAARDEEE